MKKIMILPLLIFILVGCGKSREPNSDHHGKHAHEEQNRTLHVPETVQQNLGFKTVAAAIKPLTRTVEVYGEIAQETEQVVHVTTPEPGRLESVSVQLGDVVDPETLLAKVITAEGEPVLLRSPSHGIVIGQYFKAGDVVDSLSSLFTITNPDVVRGSFDLYEKDLALVQIGQNVTVKTLSYPNKTFGGKVVYISPRIDQETRTVKVRVDIQNTEDHALKFGMFVTGQIEQLLDKETLLVPLEALHTVEESPLLFLKTGKETFEAVEVRLGETSSRFVEIKSGIKPGDKVVTRGSFNLKSEFLKESLGGHGHAH